MRAYLMTGVASCLSVLAALTSPVAADGALAVGISDNPSKDGFVYGGVVESKDAGAARESAMNSCRTAKVDNTEKVKKLCKIVAEFNDRCYAFAFDPKIGTPGVGWAIAKTKDEAEKQAIDNCKAKSSRERAGFCAVEKSGCDGSAK